MFLQEILKEKTISVWGLGYLGYTTILKLQDSGFNILAYDFNQTKMKDILTGRYPSKEQIVSWSGMGYAPSPNIKRIKIFPSPDELFKNSRVHFIAIPEHYSVDTKEFIVSKLARAFFPYLKSSNLTPLILFEAAYFPGHIEEHFINFLRSKKITCPEKYYLGVWFRTDWKVESFIGEKQKMPIAAFEQKSQHVLCQLFDYLGIPNILLGDLKEAEIYINSINTIQAMANDFFRQLSFGYPSVDIKKVAKFIFENIKLDDCDLNLGTGGTKMTSAIDYLIKGSDNPGYLTLLKEFQDINISSVLNYAEYIIRKGYRKVTILGLTYKGNQKDLTLSPSITLADYLIKNSVQVYFNDPLFTKDEIFKLVKGVKIAEFPNGIFSTDVLILASDHNEYKYLDQSMLDSMPKKTKLIIDNYGIWSDLHFGDKIKYHQVGTGSLELLK